MNLLVFSYFYPPFVGGAELIARAGARGLARRGHTVTVLTAAPRDRILPAAVEEDGVLVIRDPQLHPALPEDEDFSVLYERVAHLLDCSAFDGVHSHLLTYPWVGRRSAAILAQIDERRLPLVDQAHGGDPELQALRCVELMQRVERVVSDSDYATRRMERAFDLGAPKFERAHRRPPRLPMFHTLYPAIVDYEVFRPNLERRRRVRAALGLSDEFVVFFPSRFFDIDGSFSTRKKPLIAAKAFARFAERSGAEDIRFFAIAPEGFGASDVEQQRRWEYDSMLKENHVFDRTIMLHRSARHDEMAGYFDAADVALVPSVEGFGLVYLEAISCGTPVVTLREGASGEVLGEETGVLVDSVGEASVDGLAEALMELYRNPKMRETLGLSGVHRARTRFPFETWVVRLEAFLMESFAALTTSDLEGET